MENHTNNNNIQDEVLSAIREGEIAMKPRWGYVLRAVIAALGALVLLLALLYAVSFVVFMSRFTGAAYAPSMIGPRGWRTLLVSLPWLTIVFSVLFAGLFEFLIRRYEFSYRRPAIYSVLAIIILVIGGSFAIAGTPFHRSVARFGDRHQIGFIRGLYGEEGQPEFSVIHRGVVTAVATDTIMFRTRHGDVFEAVVGPATRLPQVWPLSASDTIIVFGDASGTVIDAAGIRSIPLGDDPWRR